MRSVVFVSLLSRRMRLLISSFVRRPFEVKGQNITNAFRVASSAVAPG